MSETRANASSARHRADSATGQGRPSEHPHRPRRVAGLTGLRAVAALMVCVTHVAYWTRHYTPDLAGSAFARLEVGVPIFFALSGYLLFRPWVNELRGGPTPRMRTYTYHRVRRVIPAYWIVVIAIYTLGIFRPDGNPSGHGATSFIRNFTFTQIYTPGHLRLGFTQSWSMCVEVVFYLLLPLIAWLMCTVICRGQWRPRRLLMALAGFGLLAPAWIVFINYTDFISPAMEPFYPPAASLSFAAGMAIAVLAHLIPGWHPQATVLLLLIALLLYLMVCSPLGGTQTLFPTGLSAPLIKQVSYAVIAACVIAPLGLATHRDLYGRVMSWRPLVWLGTLSYEFFLIHMIVIEIVTGDILGYPHVFMGSFWAVFGLTVVITIPLAWGLHRITTIGMPEPDLRK